MLVLLSKTCSVVTSPFFDISLVISTMLNAVTVIVGQINSGVFLAIGQSTLNLKMKLMHAMQFC